MARWYGALTAVALAGCLVDVDYSDTRFRCDDTADCPGDLQCRAGVCTGEPEPAIDAAADAPATDAAAARCGDGLCTEPCAGCPADCGVCPDPVLRWTFDSDGAEVVDVSGNGLHGVIEGAVRVSGARGGALMFDGGADRAILEVAPMSLEPATEVAMAAWIQAPLVDSGEVISLGDNYAVRAIAGGDARIFVYDGADWTGSTTTGAGIDDGQWHHVVGQLTGAALEVYIDGELAQTVPYDLPIDYSLGAALVVGKHGELFDSFDFVGLIDDVAVFDRALTADEITGLARF